MIQKIFQVNILLQFTPCFKDKRNFVKCKSNILATAKWTFGAPSHHLQIIQIFCHKAMSAASTAMPLPMPPIATPASAAAHQSRLRRELS
jgi:hypothetical protein